MVLFVRMWALAHIIHLVSATGSSLYSPWNIVVVAAAIALILRPASGPLLLTMMLGQVADYVAEMPTSPDHWALITLVNAAFLITMAVRRSWSPDTIALAFPAARILVLIAYSAAALSKYNADFLDPLTSCANAIASTASFGAAQPLLLEHSVFIYASLAFETAIPIMLAIPMTRRYGVRVAMVFHFALSASPVFAVVDFTAALYALFFLFLPAPDIERISARLRDVSSRSAIVRDAQRVPPLTAALAFVTLGFGGYVAPTVAAALVYVAAELYLLAMLLVALSTWRGTATPQRVGRLAWAHVPVLALALVWAMSPYLGLRTTGVFTMFSGIRTEGTAPNHLFVPSQRLTDWQAHLVTLESSNDQTLDDAADNHLAVPLLALRRMAGEDPELTVTGTLRGEPVTYGPGESEVALQPLPYWQEKLLHFRPVMVERTNFCSNS